MKVKKHGTEFVINVRNTMRDCFYSKYEKNIHGMISNDNYEHLSENLIWNENGIPLLSKKLGLRFMNLIQ